VLLEAWANGIPNVVYRAGGPPWVIRDEQDGLVIKCGDIGAFADALLRLEIDADLRKRLGAKGNSRLAEFQWDDKLALVRRTCLELARRPK
jgi:glycosyltransferase involved in cell wall biosynthesis